LPSHFEKHSSKYRLFFFLVFSFLIVHSTWKLLKSPLAKGDFEQYRFAAHQIISGEDIYRTTSRPINQGGAYYLYAPLFAILFVPFAFLPIGIGALIWCLLNVALIYWSTKTFYEVITGAAFKILPTNSRWIIAIVPILLSLRFLLYHLDYGQANILVMALMILGLRLIRSGGKKSILGGGVAGVSIAIKFVTAPFAFWFLLERNLRILVGLISGLLLSWLLPSLLLGFPLNFSTNVSLQAELYRFFSEVPAFTYNGQEYYFTIFQAQTSTIQSAQRLISLAVLGAMVLYRMRFRKSSEIVARWGGCALTFALIPIFTPTAQQHYFVFLLPGYVYVIYVWHCLRLTDKWFRGLIIASFVVASLTTDGICGQLLGDIFNAAGCIVWGTLLLAAAIFRAGSCLSRQSGLVMNPPVVYARTT
jgi:alpha-1,2-mannosyltransferase